MKSGRFEFEIEAPFAGERLDRFLVDKLPGLSRASIQRLIKEDCVQVDGQRSKANHPVRSGEKIYVTIPEPRARDENAAGETL